MVDISQIDYEKELLIAVRDDNQKRLKHCMENISRERLKEVAGWGLVVAAQLNHASLCKTLLEVDANYQFGGDKSALYHAYKNKNNQIIKLILDRIADSRNPLAILITDSCVHAIEDYFKHYVPEGTKLDINKQDVNGDTLLHTVCRTSKNPSIIKAFVGYGADQDIENDLGETVFDICKNDMKLLPFLFGFTSEHYIFPKDKPLLNERIIRVLAKCDNNEDGNLIRYLINLSHKYNKNLFCEACAVSLEAVKNLISYVDINQPTEEGMFPIINAMEHEQYAIFDLLVQDERIDLVGANVFAVALDLHSIQYVECLLANNVKVKNQEIITFAYGKDRKNNPALANDFIEAITYDFQNAIKFFLDLGVNVDTVANGKSALYQACKYGNRNTVKLLLQHGTKVNLKNHDVLAECTDDAIIKLIKEKSK